VSEDWNLQTNLKPKPNAQGTLFSGGKSQIPAEKRYPRGYTPERMAEVVNTVQFPDSKGYNRETPRDYLQRAQAIQNVARSTIPTSEMEGLTVKVLPMKGSTITGRSEYDHEDKAVKLMQYDSRTDTVVHEIGHHASHLLGTEHSAYNTPRARGEEEGFADAYADKHFREDPQAKAKYLDTWDQRRGVANYTPHPIQTRDSSGKSRAADFTRGYNAMRPMEGRVSDGLEENNARALSHLDPKPAPQKERLF
jgi:hypothetical protein